MKQPRLPGAEKFKFSSPLMSPPPPQSQSVSHDISPPIPLRGMEKSPSSVTTTPRYSQSDLSPLTPTLSVQSLHRTESRRRPVLPITCKKTSRMLTNTNLELNVDPAELVLDDSKPTRPNLDVKNRVTSCPNLESSSRSLNSSKTSLDAYFRKMSLQNQNTICETSPSNVDWMNIRASPSRLSASCSSSTCSSEENVWVLREDIWFFFKIFVRGASLAPKWWCTYIFGTAECYCTVFRYLLTFWLQEVSCSTFWKECYEVCCNVTEDSSNKRFLSSFQFLLEKLCKGDLNFI